MFKKISKTNLNSINNILQQQAQLGIILGVTNIQQNRYMRDCSTGEMVGVDKMNTDLHGWDGVFKNGKYFENKNVKVNSKAGTSYSLTFRDTSAGKLIEMTDGVIAVQSFWGDDGKRAFSMVGNTNYVGDYLNDAWNPDSRYTTTVSMSRCLKRGFKLVAGTYTKQQVIDAIKEKFPRLGSTLNPADIYTEKQAKKLVASMM